MNFALDDDQQLLVETVRRFAERMRGWAADADRQAAPPAQLLGAADDLGLLVDAVPAAHGGPLDGAYSHLARALRGIELGRGCAALAALLEHNVEPALAVAKHGSPEAQRALFPALIDGAFACHVHDSRGALHVDGDRITGKLGPAPLLGDAAYVLVSTQDFIALCDARKLRREPIAPSGWRAARWGIAHLEAHPADFVISRDAAAVDELLAWGRVSLAARAVGVAQAAIEHAEAYGKERVQFGQPIGRFEALVRMRDDAQTQIRAARLVTLEAAWQLDRGLPTAHDAASRARVLAGDCVARVTIDAVQMFGGYGFVNDFPVEKLMRDARAFEALYGDERLGRVLAHKGS